MEIDPEDEGVGRGVGGLGLEERFVDARVCAAGDPGKRASGHAA